MVTYRVARIFFFEFNSSLQIGDFVEFCGNYFFGIVKDWFFLLGINFCEFKSQLHAIDK